MWPPGSTGRLRAADAAHAGICPGAGPSGSSLVFGVFDLQILEGRTNVLPDDDARETAFGVIDQDRQPHAEDNRQVEGVQAPDEGGKRHERTA